MNVLTLIFSLLLILSYGFYASWDKQVTSQRLKTTYRGHQTAHRKLLNQYQSALYKQLRGNLEKAEPVEEDEDEESPDVPIVKKDPIKKPDPNRECAELNLWPLIQEGKSNHPLLFELALKIIRTFYPSLLQEKNIEVRLLNALLSSAKIAIQEQEANFSLEKVDLGDERLQRIYYKMLKGTKEWDLALQKGYPSLLDYMKADAAPDKICIFHAHPDLTTALFGRDVAQKLHAEIHKKEPTLLTQELIQRICSEMHQTTIDPDIFALLELGKPNHEEKRKTFIAKEADVLLRKNITIKST
jgi:hypothetical protein